MAEPARRYKWRDAWFGNELNLRHGTMRVDRAERVAAQVGEIAERVAERYPWTAAFEDERRAYARALVDERDVRAWLDTVGSLDEEGRERPAVRTLDRFVGHAARCRAALGISPQAHASLLLKVAEVVRLHPDRAGSVGDALDSLIEEGRRILGRQGAAGALESGVGVDRTAGAARVACDGNGASVAADGEEAR